MSNLGRFQTGQTIFLSLQVPGAVVPDDVPTITVTAPGPTVVLADKEIPVKDPFNAKGLFHFPLFLGLDYLVTGDYTIDYTWTVASVPDTAQDTFTIVGGGHPDGQVMSMYFYHRPHADFVVHQTELGKISAGRNPKV